MSHRRAKLTEYGRWLLVNRVLEEWAYVRSYRSNTARSTLLDRWLHMYNHHRSHTALGGCSPIERVNNLRGNYN